MEIVGLCVLNTPQGLEATFADHFLRVALYTPAHVKLI